MIKNIAFPCHSVVKTADSGTRTEHRSLQIPRFFFFVSKNLSVLRRRSGLKVPQAGRRSPSCRSPPRNYTPHTGRPAQELTAGRLREDNNNSSKMKACRTNLIPKTHTSACGEHGCACGQLCGANTHVCRADASRSPQYGNYPSFQTWGSKAGPQHLRPPTHHCAYVSCEG